MDDLLRLEGGFWRASGDRAAYEAHLADDAIHVFPGMGIVGRGDVLASVADAEPWERFEILEPRLVELGAGAAVLVYVGDAERSGGRRYRAAMTSVYRRGADGWVLVVHQQTPIPID
jgi:hypothetical protein